MSGLLQLVQKVFPCCPCAPHPAASPKSVPAEPPRRPSWPPVNATKAHGQHAQLTLMQDKKNPVHVNAQLLMGSNVKFSAALEAAAKEFGTEKRTNGADFTIVDLKQELPLGELSKVAVLAVMVLNPVGADDWGKCDSYKKGYKEERKIGVAKLSATGDAVYILPPVPAANTDSEDIYKVLEFAGMPKTPGHAMLGLVVTSMVGAQAGA